MGHFFHGSSLASASHVERYGLRTISGNTGGFSVDAATKLTRLPSSTAAVVEGMVGMQKGKGPSNRGRDKRKGKDKLYPPEWW